MSLVETFTVGRLTCHLLDAGRQGLDGGAMFGVVPKPLWERKIAPDLRNRIPLALRCLLIDHEEGPILVDTGVGNKESAKFLDIYAVENSGESGHTKLDDALVSLGLSNHDIKYVVNTHLHFDHAGGNTFTESEGHEAGVAADAQLAFPNATYVVQRGELEFARIPNERTAASYLPPNFEPVALADKWYLAEGETDLVPGITLLPTPGHVPFHQSVLVRDGGEAACYVADLIPTAAHVPLPWIMGYDLEPLVTLETKRNLLARAVAEDWRLLLEHDPDHGIGVVVPDAKGYRFEPA